MPDMFLFLCFCRVGQKLTSRPLPGCSQPLQTADQTFTILNASTGVAAMFSTVAGSVFSTITTGAQITIDGGNDRVI